MGKISLLIVLLSFLISSGFSENQPELQESPPWFHEVRGAISRDGITFTEIPMSFFKQASVPDIVEITVNDSKAAPKGTMILYFLDFSNYKEPNQETISMSTSVDGYNWTPKKPVNVFGNNKPIAVDPTIIELSDGRLRMYFLAADFSDTSMQEKHSEFLSAVSENGFDFLVEPGVRLQAPYLITDPEVERYGNEWFMIYLAPDGPHLARSKDGLSWDTDKRFKVPGGSVLMPGGKIRVFDQYGKDGWKALYELNIITPDNKKIHLKEGHIGDATCIRRMDGSFYMVRKYALIK
jgi:hypothetical protein